MSVIHIDEQEEPEYRKILKDTSRIEALDSLITGEINSREQLASLFATLINNAQAT